MTKYFSLTAFILSLCLATPASYAQDLSSQPSIWAAKPDAAAFDKIIDEHVAGATRAVRQLEAVKGSRTVENTLSPFDEAIRHIDSAWYFAGLMQEVHPDKAFRDHASQAYVKAGKAFNELMLNRSVYDALSGLDVTQADPPTRYYVQRTLLEFHLAGVDKDEATRKQLQHLQDELIGEQTDFDRNIQEGEKTVLVDSAAELDGLPPDYIERHKPQADGKIHITTQYPDIGPVFKFAKREDLRLRMSQVFRTQAYPKNLDVLRRMMKTRYDIARLLGYPSWADYNAADKMIGNGTNIRRFIEEVDASARPIGQREFAVLLQERRKTHPSALRIEAYNLGYLQEQVRRSAYDFDSQTLRPYLPFAQVKKGIFDTAAKLFEVEFRQEQNAPAWTSEAETWDVFRDGKPLGRFYLDLHPRTGKYSHANMVAVLDGVRGRQLPEAALVCNLPSPSANDPGLLDYYDVNTFFHEFGHLMHWILSAQQWAGLNFYNLENDFIEAPSTMLEDWLQNPDVLRSFARHYKTGEPLPLDLIRRMNRANAFGRGIFVMQQNRVAAVSYELYGGNPDNIDPDEVIAREARQYDLFVPIAHDRYYASFSHLSGVSSAYYMYLWDRVIAEDFFTQFNSKDPFQGPTPLRYRTLVLEPGGSSSANDLVRNFLGRPQNTAAFKRWLSEEFQNDGEAATRGALSVAVPGTQR